MNTEAKKQKNEPNLRLTTGKGILLLLIFIGINLTGKYISATFSMPVWMDSVGTCLAAYYLGVPGAVIAGLACNVVFGAVRLVSVCYAGVSVLIGLVFCFCVRRGYLADFTKAMLSSFMVGVISVAFSAPINLFFQNGYTGNRWGDALFDMMQWYGYPRVFSAIMDEAIVDIFDKQLCVALVFCIIHFAGKVKKGRRTAQTGVFVLAVVLSAAAFHCETAYAKEASAGIFENYQEQIYDSSSGMSVSEANAIEETSDGYIWIGSYAGLTRYDSNTFEFIPEDGVASVTAMTVSSDGTMWIGTNDSGLMKYDDEVFTSFTKENGLPVNSIRSFAEGSDGTMYIGTTDKICKMTADGTITVLDTDVTYVNSLLCVGDKLIGVSNDGRLFLIRDEKIVSYAEDPVNGDYYTCVADTSSGLLAGTSGTNAVLFDMDHGGLEQSKILKTGSLSYMVKICEDKEERIWLCTETGFGYMGSDGTLYESPYEDFSVSIQSMHEDYEGNLWFASSRYGVLKLSRNYFDNVFDRCGAENAVTNAVVNYNGFYYCGTDDGLTILDSEKRTYLANELTDMLSGSRVRSLMEDSEGNLWIATYSDYGLICLSKDGAVSCYNTGNAAVTGDRFRCLSQLSDGSIVAGASSGINVFKDGKLVYTIGGNDGLKNEQVLCLMANEDGSFYAGTDGAGIYLIKDGQIQENLTIDDGLGSDIVLRMQDYGDGFFIVASNALQYYDGEQIRKIPEFPYFNNYDILTNEDEDSAYVIASCGVFQVKASDLLKEDAFAYKLYNNADGLTQGLTSNSWNCIDTDGALLLCTNEGLIRWDKEGSSQDTTYRLGLTAVRGDGKLIEAVDGVYEIPAETARISVRASVRNYALSNVKVRFYIDGISANDEITAQNELQTIQINNLSQGSYTVHLQVMSADESRVLQEETYVIHKQAHFWETAKYKVYLILMLLWIIIFVTWVCITVYHLYMNRGYLEARRLELEQTVAQQTSDIREQSDRMERFQWNVIDSMANLIEGRDTDTGDHALRTRDYVRILIDEIRRRGLYPDIVTEEFASDIIHLAPLHDVGKIKISDAILNKPGKLTEEEYAEMKKHTLYGEKMIVDILGADATPYMAKIAKDLAAYHHERPDGKGYPYGLKGEEIPLAARIMSIADVFDAITSPRVYKKARSFEEGFVILAENAGTQFDAELIGLFLSLKEEVKQEDVKQEDVIKLKQEDVKQEDVKQEDVKQEDVKQEDVKQEDVKEEDVKEDTAE